jgi:hypothetical protein
MKSALFVIFLMVPALALAVKPNPADYTIVVHVQSSKLVNTRDTDFEKSICNSELQLVVLIDGNKFELQDQRSNCSVIHVGDYKARIAKEDTSHSYSYTRSYEILFPDGTTRTYSVVGESE